MIIDFDDAYTNVTHIAGGADYPERWSSAAADFRSNLPAGCSAQFDVPYGNRPRNRFDLFLPAGKPKGLTIFVHGGYWMRFSKDYWSHFARGPLLRGWAVAMPGYTLTPDVGISDITLEIRDAVLFLSSQFSCPIRLAGHSAGGHLVTRMINIDTKLPERVSGRIESVVSISGLHDLRPLLRTKMNATLKLSTDEATRESPALLAPLNGIPVICWVGADERPEFVRQNDLLANIWVGFGLEIRSRHSVSRHHFNVIDDLLDPNSEMTMLLAA